MFDVRLRAASRSHQYQLCGLGLLIIRQLSPSTCARCARCRFRTDLQRLRYASAVFCWNCIYGKGCGDERRDKKAAHHHVTYLPDTRNRCIRCYHLRTAPVDIDIRCYDALALSISSEHQATTNMFIVLVGEHLVRFCSTAFYYKNYISIRITIRNTEQKYLILTLKKLT